MGQRMNEIMDELDRFRKDKSALDKLTSKMIAFEAAMVVLARHGLMVEFAGEIMKIERGPVSNGDRTNG